jgi:hypothetical protein
MFHAIWLDSMALLKKMSLRVRLDVLECPGVLISLSGGQVGLQIAIFKIPLPKRKKLILQSLLVPEFAPWEAWCPV